MAGAGYKLFQTGDVLTAAQVNTYLNEQTVMVFANAAARTSALTSVLAEGMMSYLQDTNAVEVYNGSSWVAVGGGGGDVTEVQAGTGISVADGTGPIPIVTNTVATTFDAKGDLVVGTGADTFAKLTVGGTNGHTLQVDSSTATGLKWAAAAGGGKILQVVSAELDTQGVSSSSTYADTGLTATITPTSASSTILVISNCAIGKDTGNTGVSLRLLRGATTIKEFARRSAGTNNTNENFVGTFSHSYIDSPATTSATTYKVQFASYNNTANAFISGEFGGVREKSTILLMEIGA